MVKGSCIWIRRKFICPRAPPTGEDLWEIGEVSEYTLEKDALKCDVDWRRNKDSTYSSWGTNEQSAIDVLQRWHKRTAPTHTSRIT